MEDVLEDTGWYKEYLEGFRKKSSQAFKECPLFFVYGTLKRGYSNNHILSQSEYLGRHITKESYVMGNIGFPYVFSNNLYVDSGFQKQVVGDLYKVDSEDTALQLDSLEGEGRHYHRSLIKTTSGDVCWIYLQKDATLLKSCRICTETEEGYWQWP